MQKTIQTLQLRSSKNQRDYDETVSRHEKLAEQFQTNDIIQ
jgi:hypothetical protein